MDIETGNGIWVCVMIDIVINAAWKNDFVGEKDVNFISANTIKVQSTMVTIVDEHLKIVVFFSCNVYTIHIWLLNELDWIDAFSHMQ